MIKTFKQLCASHWTSLHKDQRGAAALTVFFIVLAVSIILVSTTSFIGLDNLTIGFAQQASSHLILSAESCVEEAIVRLSRDNTYVGGTLSVGDAACTILVSGTPCGECTIDAQAVGDGFTRKIQADVIVAGSTVDVVSWKEQE